MNLLELAHQWPSALFFNDQFTVAENLILWANLFGTGFAIFWNGRALRSGVTMLRSVHAVTGMFATIYFIGYLTLLLTDVGYPSWSALFRGISIPVWIFVWSYPAIRSEHIARRSTNLADEFEAVLKVAGK